MKLREFRVVNVVGVNSSPPGKQAVAAIVQGVKKVWRRLVPDPVQRERLLLLHQLNSITRFTHGATAFVSVDNTLMLSREVAIEGLSGEGLKHTLAQVLDAATDLRAAWTHLRELIVRAGRAAQGQTEAEGLLSSHRLV